jgi:hypothetical protein
VSYSLCSLSGSRSRIFSSYDHPVRWTQRVAGLDVTLPATLPGDYDWVLRMDLAK